MISAHAGARAVPRRDMTLLDIFTVILRHRRLVFGLPLVLTLLVVATTLMQRRQYTATAAFMPQAGDASRLAALGGLAAQFGMNLPTADQGQSPEFYADLVLSRTVLGRLLDTTYRFTDLQGRTQQGNLITLLEIDGDSPGLQRDEAMRDMERRVGVERNLRTGLIQVRTRTPWPDLSVQMTQHVLNIVNDFNLKQRQEKATAEREFAEERLQSIRAELRSAEEALVSFERRNRAYGNSPDLAAEHDRLQRAVSMRQQLFMSFSQMYEQARVDAVRNTPLITVVERPMAPARPDSRRGLLKVIMSLVGGGLLALMIAFIREFASPERAVSDSAYAEFQAVRREAARDLRNPFGAIFRRKRTAS